MPSDTTKGFPVEEEYKKEKAVQSQDIARLREWVTMQPHLPAQHITDLDLVLTYHCCDFSSEVSKEVLDLNLTLRTLFSEMFKDRVVDKRVKMALNGVLITMLSTRSKEGDACFYSYFLERGLKNFVFLDIVRVAFMILDLWQYENGTCPGLILVYDLEDMTLGHLTKLDLQTLQQLIYFLQEAMLIRVKGLHFINAPPFMNKLLAILKPFMKQKLLDVVYVHQSGSRTLDEHYPVDALPGDAAARLRLRESEMKKLESNAAFFSEENKKRVTECRRPGKPKTVTDFFGGLEGSFKKLDID